MALVRRPVHAPMSLRNRNTADPKSGSFERRPDRYLLKPSIFILCCFFEIGGTRKLSNRQNTPQIIGFEGFVPI